MKIDDLSSMKNHPWIAPPLMRKISIFPALDGEWPAWGRIIFIFLVAISEGLTYNPANNSIPAPG
jgi:hypothetical protein